MLLHLVTAWENVGGLNTVIASTPGAVNALRTHLQKEEGSVKALSMALGTFSRGDVGVPGRWAHMGAGCVRLSDVVELQCELRQLLNVIKCV